MAAKKKTTKKKAPAAKKKAAPARGKGKAPAARKKAKAAGKAPARRRSKAVAPEETLTTLAPALAEVPPPAALEPAAPEVSAPAQPETLTSLAPELAETPPAAPGEAGETLTTLAPALAEAPPAPPAPSAPAARFDAGEGLQDLVLPIAGVQGGGGPPWVIRALGTLGGEQVGLDLVLRSDMRPGLTDKGEVDHGCFYKHGVVWRSIGAPSDALGRAVARALGVPREGRFPPELSFTAFALSGDPRRLAAQPVRLRLEQAAPALEVILEVNLPAREVALREKDAELRRALVATLLGGA